MHRLHVLLPASAAHFEGNVLSENRSLKYCILFLLVVINLLLVKVPHVVLDSETQIRE